MSVKYRELPYAYDALEPTIDKATMEFHHDKHYKTYCEKYNEAVQGTKFDDMDVSEVLAKIEEVPEEKRAAVRNNGGGAMNHEWFWEVMTPGGAKEPQGKLKEAIDEAFGSFDQFKEKFEKAGAGQFGSGWAWLVLNKDGKLEVISTPNQNNPVSDGYQPVLGNDVWEHAYYLKYQNRRPDYLKAWWDVVNWDIVGKKYDELKK